MSTKLSFLLRNRRVHLLLVVGLLFALLTHTLRGQGISLQYADHDPHSSELTYSSILETLESNVVVSDIQVRRCVRGFSCAAPPDNLPSYWVKIPTKLNLFPTSVYFFNYYMYVQKAHGNEAERFIIDVLINSNSEPPNTKVNGAKWLGRKIASGATMWILYLEQIDFTVPIVRDVNVLFGKQDLRDTRPHWKFTSNVPVLPGKYEIQAKLSLLMVAVTQEMEILSKEQEFNGFFKKNGILTVVDPKIKVVQITDMHIGQDMGTCFEKCKFDINTLKFVKSALEKEGDVKLVIITGDMIDFTRAKHFESVVLKALSPILEARIPFVFTFGDSDHDWQNQRSKINMINFIASLPGCYNNKFSDLDHRVHGVTNGNLKVYHIPPVGDPTKEKFDYNKLPLENPNAVITYLDSEGQKVDATQSNYLYRIKHRLSPSVDLKMLFFHNPLPNFRPEGKFKLIGSYNEKHRLITETDKKFLLDVKACGYKVVAVGHEHENDACIWNEDELTQTLLCFVGVTGESGNTQLDVDYKRRLRVFEVDFSNNKILSWKRDQEKSIDPQEIWSPAEPVAEVPPAPPALPKKIISHRPPSSPVPQVAKPEGQAAPPPPPPPPKAAPPVKAEPAKEPQEEAPKNPEPVAEAAAEKAEKVATEKAEKVAAKAEKVAAKVAEEVNEKAAEPAAEAAAE